ncbi:MAG: proteasome assembly chaperone family protein, partial [Candidatus Aenigmatarchaeota archaeon]
MTTKIIEFERPKLKNPLFVEGLPGVGNVGRIAAGYLAEELKAKKFAELFSSHFMPFVLLHQTSAVHVLKNEFYYWKAKEKNQRDLIILIGDSQSINPEGHYEIVETILDYISGFGCKEMITLAGLSVGEITTTPKVIGAVSDNELIEKYKKYGIDFEAGSKVGTIVGASGLLVGMGRVRGIKGVCLLGETLGFPIIPDPKSAESVLKVLIKIL